MEKEYIKKPLNVLIGDLQRIVEKSKAYSSKFNDFHELICEKIERTKESLTREWLPVDLYESLSVSGINDDSFTVEFLGREYVVKYSFDAYSASPGCVTCYLVHSFPSIEYRKVDSFVFTENGHTDKTESDNKTPIIIASGFPLLYILLSWLDSSLYIKRYKELCTDESQ